MSVDEILRRRSSIRAFRADPVDPDLLARVIEGALQSPSWSNVQPYLLAVASGTECEALRRELIAASSSLVPSPEYPMLFEYPAPLNARRRATGFGLYGVLGIRREDHAAREEQYRRNFAFFGAPTVAFLFAHEALGAYAVLDAGVFLQSILLCGTAEGLGMCAQASLASYPDVVRGRFDVPDGYRLLCGISIGHPADEAVNRFRPVRMTPGELLLAPRADETPDRPGR
ncbi:nitroreductase [bacterium]|nr:nitroreductase [bacterium]